MESSQQKSGELLGYGESSRDWIWEDHITSSRNSSTVFMQCPSYYVQSPSRDDSNLGNSSYCSPFLNKHSSHSNPNQHSHRTPKESAAVAPSESSVSSSFCKRGYSGWLVRQIVKSDGVLGHLHFNAHPEQQPGDDEDDEISMLTSWRFGKTREGDKSGLLLAAQLFLGVLISSTLFIALFCLATRPTSPGFQIKEIDLCWFRMPPGSDRSGVPTKVLTSKFTVTMEMDNPSKFFGVHVEPARLSLSYREMLLATSQGDKMYVDSERRVDWEVNIESRRKAVYGAGPSMTHSLLNNNKAAVDGMRGLVLLLHIGVKSSIRVVWDLVRPSFHHHAICYLYVDGTLGSHFIILSNTTCIYHHS